MKNSVFTIICKFDTLYLRTCLDGHTVKEYEMEYVSSTEEPLPSDVLKGLHGLISLLGIYTLADIIEEHRLLLGYALLVPAEQFAKGA